MAAFWQRRDYFDVILGLGDNPYAATYERLMPKAKGLHVIEFGCGVGGLLLPLARAGYMMSGVDGNPRLISELRNRAARAHLKVHLSVCEITRFNSRSRFDIVILSSLLVNTAKSRAAQTALLSTAATHLKPRGRMIVEFADTDFFDRVPRYSEPQQTITRTSLSSRKDGSLWNGDVTYRFPAKRLKLPLRLILSPHDALTEQLGSFRFAVSSRPKRLNPASWIASFDR